MAGCVLRSVGGSGFDQVWDVRNDTLEVRSRWAPGRLERGATVLQSRHQALRAQVLLHYPALWWAGTRGLAPLHVSVLELDGVVVLLAGPGGVGKSTLVSRAVAEGARATCDNLAVSDGTTAHGLRESMRLDAGTAAGRADRPDHPRPARARLDSQVPSLRPDLVVVAAARRRPAGARRSTPEVAQRALVAGTYRRRRAAAVLDADRGARAGHRRRAGAAGRRGDGATAVRPGCPAWSSSSATRPGPSLREMLAPPARPGPRSRSDTMTAPADRGGAGRHPLHRRRGRRRAARRAAPGPGPLPGHLRDRGDRPAGRPGRSGRASRSSSSRAWSRPSRRGPTASRLGRLEALFAQRQFDVVHTHSAKAGAARPLGGAPGRHAADRAHLPRLPVPRVPEPGPPGGVRRDRAPARRASPTSSSRSAPGWPPRRCAAGWPGRSRCARSPRSSTAGSSSRRPPPGPPPASGSGCPPDVPVVGTVGRLDFQKAPEHFVDAVAALRHTDAVAVWVGGGPLLDEVRDLVARRGLSDRLLLRRRAPRRPRPAARLRRVRDEQPLRGPAVRGRRGDALRAAGRGDRRELRARPRRPGRQRRARAARPAGRARRRRSTGCSTTR